MKRISLLTSFFLLALVMIVSTAGGPVISPARAATIHPAVLADLQASPDGRATFFLLLAEQADLGAAESMNWLARGRWVFETLQSTAAGSQAALQGLLASKALARHVAHWQPFWIVNTILVEGDAEALDLLARQPGVAQILPRFRLEAPELVFEEVDKPSAVPDDVQWNLSQIHADDVWALGYTGEGIVVSNVDTGVEYVHPALVNQYRGNLGDGTFDHDYNWVDPFWGSTAPQAQPSTAYGVTPNSHGTHVMGTEVGDDGGAHQIGVAPGARWVAGYGCCPNNETLVAALQWQLAPTRQDGSEPNPDMRPHVVQNSWGGPGGSLIFNQVAENLKAAGIFVSASAGNEGWDGCGSLGSPGDNPAFFSVGATTSADEVGAFSSRGPDPFTGKTGPDLAAPGSGIVSSVGTNGYASNSGTSMAGPHVAGAVALLWGANPWLIGRVDYTAELLRKTAEPLLWPGDVCGGVDSGATVPNNSAGWGELDVLRAVQIAGAGDLRGRLAVQVVDDAGLPLPGVELTLRKTDPAGKLVDLTGVTDEAGHFEYLAAIGPGKLTAELFAYQREVRTAAVPYQLIFPVMGSNQPAGKAGPGRGVEDERGGLQIVLSRLPEARLQGVVHEAGAEEKRLAAQVSLPDSPLAPVATDCSGAFSLTLPAGQHELLVEALGYEPLSVPISLTAAMTQSVALTPAWDYAVEDSRSGSVAFAWRDATGGQRFNLSDGGFTAYALPGNADFTFYGQAYSLLYPSDDGFVTFENPGGHSFRHFRGVIPYEGHPNNAIYAYGEDLNPQAGQQYGTGYDNGVYVQTTADEVVIQYNEVEHWAWGDPETFQMVLDLATDEITLQYQTVSWPDFTTAGVENAAGDRGVVYSYANSADLAAGLAVRFSPVFGQAGVSCR